MFIRSLSFIGASAVLASCQPDLVTADQFLASFSDYCGKAYAGKLVSNDAVDASFAEADIVMHIRDCSGQEVRIPLHVGENRSRAMSVHEN